MWFDWAKIGLLDSVLFSILCLLTLYLVGSGILRLILSLSKKSDPFGSFDFLVRTNFRILFGFIFIFLLFLIFSFFNLPVLVSTLAILATAIVGFAVSFRNLKFKLPKKINLRKFAVVFSVLIILFVTVFLSSMLITGFFGSTNDDGADHTLMIRVILDHPNALFTRISQPFASFLLSYPSGSHVLCGFFLTLLNVPIQKIVMMIVVILPTLIALSFYSTIKCLFESKALAVIGLITAAFFTFGISIGPLSWAGLPLLLSLYISISSLGLIFVFLLKNKMTYLNASLLGLIFFISSQTYPVALLIVTLWFLLILSLKLFYRVRSVPKLQFSVPLFLSRRNILLAIAFFLPLLFNIPYFYVIYTNYVSGNSFTILNSVTDASVDVSKSIISFNWLFDVPALSLFFSKFGKLLALVPISLIVLIALFIPQVSKKLASVFPSKEFRRSLFLIYFFMLVIMSYLTLTLYLPIQFFTYFLDPQRVWQHIFISGTIMTAFVIFFGSFFVYLEFRRLLSHDRVNLGKLKRNRIIVFVLLGLLIFNVVLMSIPIVTEQREIYQKVGLSFNTYETLKADDLTLMKWITENVSSQAHILVSSGDSGQFVTSVTQKLTVYRYSYLRDYSELMSLLTSNSSDLRAVPIMVEYNVSYVYIGSKATTYAQEIPYYRTFNAAQFLSSPYFSLVKECGNAWLFQFNTSAALAAYSKAGSLSEFVDTWHPPTYIDVLAGEGGYTTPPAGMYYGTGRLAVEALANPGYKLDQWLLNGSYLTGPEKVVIVDYWNWTIQPVFTKTS
jgi:hypothetical protein